MAFPEAQRVIYEKNPLREVVCQFRFPPILRIDAESPVQFQDLVRDEYPLYQAMPALRLPPGVLPNVAQMIAASLPMAGQKAHVFESKDSTWNLSLSREILGLSCQKYERWEIFRERLSGAVQALLQVYRPLFFTRMDLRYVDVIQRSKLGLDDVEWEDLIQPWIAGPLSCSDISPDIDDLRATLALALPDDESQLQSTYGLAMDQPSEEEIFVIDADFWCEEQKEPSNALEHLNSLNRQAGRFFQWCIRPRLHDALGPRPAAPAT